MDLRLGVMCCCSQKLWELLTFIKAIKKAARLLPPPAATCMPFEVCCEFPGYEKDIYKASTACSGMENVSPRGQLKKWQKPHTPYSCECEGHQITQLQWLRQEPPGRKSCCANLFPCCFLCCNFFQKQSIFWMLWRTEGTEFLLCLDLFFAWLFSRVLLRNPKAKLALSKMRFLLTLKNF